VPEGLLSVLYVLDLEVDVRFPDLLRQVNDLEEQVRAHDEVLAKLLRGVSPALIREEYLDGLGEEEGDQIRRVAETPPA